MKKKFTTALVQMKSSVNKELNLAYSLELINEAAKDKARLICFPEFQMAYSPPEQKPEALHKIAEKINGNFVSTLSYSAKQNKINVIATIYEIINTNKQNHKVFDTAIIINELGKLKSVYRKVHLYDALGFRESKKLVAGSIIERPTRTSVGSLGLLICYDMRFPEISRILTVNGASILASPSAWLAGFMKQEHWEIMVKARAIENGVYVIAPNQVGNIYCGHSMVIDPFGSTLADMGNREGIEIIDIDSSRIDTIRRTLPLLMNRRTDVYKNYIDVFRSDL
ncbi:MAG TPA: carbon-nitrogen hydrolase family protein [Nitrososphaeraceae archaeon]|jgi:deaminated glutathione amidase|nr:carbon-nitrogen hydrolase family protein [Nitrososphaeraceae archaeon]